MNINVIIFISHVTLLYQCNLVGVFLCSHSTFVCVVVGRVTVSAFFHRISTLRPIIHTLSLSIHSKKKDANFLTPFQNLKLLELRINGVQGNAHLIRFLNSLTPSSIFFILFLFLYV